MLNKEDIESLGWIYNKDYKRYELNKSDILTYRYFYMYHRPGNLIYKSIITIYENGTNPYDLRVLKIEIKNKLELKVLLKQLDIDEK